MRRFFGCFSGLSKRCFGVLCLVFLVALIFPGSSVAGGEEGVFQASPISFVANSFRGLFQSIGEGVQESLLGQISGSGSSDVYTHSLKLGWNLIAPYEIPAQVMTLGDIFDVSSDIFAICTSSSCYSADDSFGRSQIFDVGSAYFVKVLSEIDLGYSSREPGSFDVRVELREGVNYVGGFNRLASYTSHSFLRNVDAAVKVAKFVSGAHQWQVAERTSSGDIVGSDFPLVAGEGYAVRASRAGVWMLPVGVVSRQVPDVSVSFPGAGSLLRQGGTYELRWTAPEAEMLDVGLYKGGVFQQFVARGVTPDLSPYSWQVPAGVREGGDYSIMVWDPRYPNRFAEAGRFSVEGLRVPVVCTQDYAPVCGVDGVTYSNRCVAEEENGVTVDYEGECSDGAVDDGIFGGGSTRGVHELGAGWNLIAPYGHFASAVSFQSVFERYGGIGRICLWDAGDDQVCEARGDTQAENTYFGTFFGSFGAPHAFFVETTEPLSFEYMYDEVDENSWELKLGVGEYRLGVPIETGYTSRSFLEEFPQADLVNRFNVSRQESETAFRTVEGVAGDDFPLVPGEGYKIQTSGELVWRPFGDDVSGGDVDVDDGGVVERQVDPTVVQISRDLGAGWNLVAPVGPIAGSISLGDVLGENSGIDQACFWDDGDAQVCFSGGDGLAGGVFMRFPEAYFLHAISGTKIEYMARLIGRDHDWTLRLSEGVNRVGFPADIGYTTRSFMETVPEVDEITWFDSDTQQSKRAFRNGSELAGEAFPLIPGWGYKIVVSSPVDWKPFAVDAQTGLSE